MGLEDTTLTKFRPDLPYMTATETALFKKMRAGGQLSFFRSGACELCGEEVLKGKRWCSKKCWETARPEPTQDEDDDDGQEE